MPSPTSAKHARKSRRKPPVKLNNNNNEETRKARKAEKRGSPQKVPKALEIA